ncbi:MAG: S8 family serine peptidase [Clostridia bacterium]|nr:S8 family serine peptidase [Clostridia bacterium]
MNLPTDIQSTNIFLRFDQTLISDESLEVIVKYNGNIESVSPFVEAIEVLNGIFAIVTGTHSQIQNLYSFPFIEYIELPKILSYELSSSRYSVCTTRAQENPYNLTGKGTAIGIIDSGIDITHPDFRSPNGTSRIVYLWDQSATGKKPQGFAKGAEYTNAEINEALRGNAPIIQTSFTDTVGHGTAVAGIACGNGSQSNGREKGIAPEASIIAVKLGNRGFGAFSRTTEVMRGIKYTLDKARELGMPLSINLSYGTNNGSHDGNSLFEQYVNSAADEWKTAICVATGNEGSAGHHFSAILTQNEELNIPFSVSGAPKKIYMTLWKNFSDNIIFKLASPTNEANIIITPEQNYNTFNIGNTSVSVFYEQPTPLTQYQEIYFLFESQNISITEGIWSLTAIGENIIDGRFDIWLPTVEDVTNDTSFSFPDTDVTLTLPSTAARVISVGGYNANTNTAATFSGRGFTRNDVYVKPDITAPAVNILTTRSGGGYMQFTGTSMASPFVAGACCLLMEWGLVQGNDLFLYGQRIKAFLQKGARRTQNTPYPNNIWGYGTLCISNTLDLLTLYNQEGDFSV